MGSIEAACSNKKEASNSVFFNILHLYNKMSLHLDGALPFKAFPYCSFASVSYCSEKLAQPALRSSSSYGQETEDLGGEMTCTKSHSF